MHTPELDPQSSGSNRRDFIRNATSFGAMMVLMGGVPLRAEDNKPAAEGSNTHYSTVSAPLSIGLIGCGPWGRQLLHTLAQLPNAPVVAICDNYEPFLRRAKESAPQADTFTDYHQLLAKKEVQGVIVATPTFAHREIVEAALAAGKHVYCEAPLASSIEDAQAIAKAAQAAVKCNFQSGLQTRSDAQKLFLLPFIRSGAIGNTIMARGQWHRKESWRRTSPNSTREQAINWRLHQATSTGLVGELGIHQLDLVSWFLNQKPAAATGLGGILKWNEDGRDVPDTVQAVIQFPQGVNFSYDSTLANSFDGEYTILYGTDAAVMMRGSKAWLFKEADSRLLGWEIYARKDQFYKETGIALVADASKSVHAQAKPDTDESENETVLESALAAFVTNSGVVSAGVADFTENFGSDTSGLRDYLASLAKARRPAASCQEGFEATVMAIKVNEAVVKGEKVVFQKEWFQV